ncbi:MAG TPA: ABC transporter permease, partial [Gemmatimonadaceae bacterium]
VTLTNVDIPSEFSRGNPNDGRLLSIDDVGAMTEVYSHVAAYASGGLNLDDPERPLRVRAGVVTTAFFATLGVHPVHGRTFSDDEGRPNGPPAVILSDHLWRTHFGGNDVLGRSVSLHGRPYTIVGVMPPGFTFPQESDLWIPLTVPITFQTFEPFRGFLPSIVVARMNRGVSLEFAAAQTLARWQQVIAPAQGASRESLAEWLAEVRAKGAAIPLRRELVGDLRRPLLVLFGVTGLLLLIACANVANLLLSDAAIRRREIALRGVLGATRRRILRQLVAESALLAAAGAGLGIVLSPAVLRVLRAMMPDKLAGVAPAQLDWRVLAFAALLIVITTLLFGLWPAIGAARGSASDALKSGGHGTTSGRIGGARRALVGTEVALTVMLLVAAGLMLRSFDRLMSENIGLDPERVATLELAFPRALPDGERLRIVEGAIDYLRRQPGIVAAGAVNDLPWRGGGGISVTVHVPDAPPPPPGQRHFVRQLIATGDYFATMGIPLIRGRTFTPADNAQGTPVVIISQGAAETWWPGRDPIGRTFAMSRNSPPMTVIGVVADVREARLDRDPRPQMYFPMHAGLHYGAALVVRGTLPPATLMAQLREAVRTVAPSQAVYNVRMMEDVIGASVAPRRTNTMLIALFAGLALVLAALGVYAVVAYGVAQRSREFGIRAALGATGRDLLALVSSELAIVVAIGVAVGLAGAWAASRVMAALLYEVDPRDPATFAVVPLVLLLPAVVATLVPAVRAMRVNPTEVMRSD